MNRSILRAATAGSALACLAGGLVLTADTGQAAPHHYTRHLVSHQKVSFQPSPHTFIAHDVVTEDGGRVGYDLVSGVGHHGAVSFHVALALEGGEILLDATATNETGVVEGRIVGGTGKFTGISGTIHSEALSERANSLDLDYTL